MATKTASHTLLNLTHYDHLLFIDARIVTEHQTLAGCSTALCISSQLSSKPPAALFASELLTQRLTRTTKTWKQCRLCK